MNRAQLFVRDARPEDAADLQTIWLDFAVEVKGHRQHTTVDSIERSDHPARDRAVRAADRRRRRPTRSSGWRTCGARRCHRSTRTTPCTSAISTSCQAIVVVGPASCCSKLRPTGPTRRTPRTWLHRSPPTPARPTDSWPVSGLAQVAVVRAVTVSTLRCKLGTAGQAIDQPDRYPATDAAGRANRLTSALGRAR